VIANGAHVESALALRAAASRVLADRDAAGPVAVQAALLLDVVSGLLGTRPELADDLIEVERRAHDLGRALVDQVGERALDDGQVDVDTAAGPSRLDQVEAITAWTKAYPDGDELVDLDGCAVRLAEQVTGALAGAPRPYPLDVVREIVLGVQLTARTLAARADALVMQLYSWRVVPADQPGALRHDRTGVPDVAGDNAHLVDGEVTAVRDVMVWVADSLTRVDELAPRALTSLNHLSHHRK
jgi:hypothetical protein